jgi:lipopolysaccharide transport system ATP-binding protein
MSSEVVVRAENLGKSYLIYRKPEDRLKQMLFRWKRYYEEYWALRNINLEIHKGESIGLIGRNGAGKSTFLQLAAGILNPTIGKIEINGRVAALLELGAGFNPEFTGSENIYLAASILGLTETEIRDRFDAIAEFAAIGDFLNLPIKLYSSGMYARLAFAVAAHVDASVLIVDEALSVGDAAFNQKCMRFIRKFRENGTLILVSHSPDTITSLCNRAIWIDSGELREVGDVKSVCDSYLSSIDRDRDDGKTFMVGGSRRPRAEDRELPKPMQALVKSNPIKVFEFDQESFWYGRRGATIEKARFIDKNGAILNLMHGGEQVILQIQCHAHIELQNPIIGFYIRDRLGQNLFGDNTYRSYKNRQISLNKGDRLLAEFGFDMPYLPSGSYAVSCAIANGTQEEHVQHHWFDEALLFDVTSSHVSGGLVGIPMETIEIKIDTQEI